MSGPPTRRKYDIGLIVPLSIEWTAIEAELERGDEFKDGSVYYYEFKIKGSRRTIIASLLGDSQYGQLNAAIRAQAMFGFADIDLFVLVGIAGSIKSDIRLGDVVIANQVVAYEEQAKAVRDGDHTKHLRSPDSIHIRERIDSALVNFGVSRTGRPRLREWEEKCGVRLAALGIDKASINEYSRDRPEAHIGHVASGNTVVAGTPPKAELIALDRNLLAVETEASGVARVAHKNDRDFLVIRGISDPSDESKNAIEQATKGKWRVYAARNAASYLRQFLLWEGSNDVFVSPGGPGPEERAYIKFKQGPGIPSFLASLSAIMSRVREMSKDSSMQHRTTRNGCIELEVEGSSQGFDRLQELLSSGELTAIEGFEVVKIVRHGAVRQVSVAAFARGRTGARERLIPAPTQQRFTEHFKLDRDQVELDFVDVTPGVDTPLFVDPHAISQRSDPFALRCQDSITSFFSRVLSHAIDGEREAGVNLLSALSEPYETCLGLSRGHTHGRGVGKLQGEDLFDRLSRSQAVKTGLVKDLGETELFVDGIGHDKISDITTNLIRRELIEFTQAQCELLGIPISDVDEMRVWDRDTSRWDYFGTRLPKVLDAAVLLVPKSFVASKPSIDSKEYYQNFVLNYLESEELRKVDSRYVYKTKSGARRVRRSELRKSKRLSKKLLLDFTEENPAALSRYKLAVGTPPAIRNWQLPAGGNEVETAEKLTRRLSKIETGQDGAAAYHKVMIGALELLLYPEFQWPRKFAENGVLELGYENSAAKGSLYSARIDPERRISHALITCSNNGQAHVQQMLERAPAAMQALLPRSILLSVSRTPGEAARSVVAGRPVVGLDDDDIRRGLAAVGTSDEGIIVQKIQRAVGEPALHV
jgi:nucleoside phosphorylase